MEIRNKRLIGLGTILLIQVLVFICPLKAQIIDTIASENVNKLQTIAYGDQVGWSVTGSISSVKGEELRKSFTTNVANTLYGRIPGLTVRQTNGEPGNDAPTLNSRGISTFGKGRDITFIIDGFPSTYELFQQLMPEEIESVSLLKDAVSTAIYGNKAANGVLLVKTRRGESGALAIKVKIRFGLQQATRLPDFLDSYNYAKLYNEARVNDFGVGSEIYSASDLNAYQNNTDKYKYPNVNWYDQMLRSLTPMSDYSITAKGGNNIVKYFVLLGLENNRGIYRGVEDVSDYTKDFSYNRYNFRTNVDIQLSKRLRSEFTLGGSVEDRSNPGRVRNEISGEYGSNIFNMMAKLPPNAFPIYHQNGQIGGNSIYYNPWAEITETGYYSTNRRAAQLSVKFIGDLGMITPGLEIAGAIGLNTIYKSYKVAKRDYARYDVNGSRFGEMVSLDINESPYNQWRNYVFHGFLTYDRQFGNHHVDALLMTGYEEYSISSVDLPFKDIVSGGRLTYSFDKRYIGEVSFAYSGSDNFARGNRFGFFPAASLGWIVSNESFLKENRSINFLKLRGSYGLTGNKDNGSARFPHNQYYSGGNYYLGESNTSTGYYLQGDFANKDATWEKDKKLNVGIDAVVFNNFDVKFDYFNQRRYEILALPYESLPAFLGFKRPALNVGKVKNQGLEAVVRYNANKSGALDWFAEAGVWFARNEIAYNGEASMRYSYQYLTGHRVDQPFMLESLGLFNSRDEISNSTSRQIFAEVQPGDIKYKNQNSDNIIDQDDFVPIGYTDLPEYTLSLHSGLKYKGFDLDILFQGVLNRSVYWGGSYFEAFQNDGKVSKIALGRWTDATKEDASYPRLSSVNNMNNYQKSSFWNKNGDFLKLRSLEIGYTIPKPMTKKIMVDEVRVYFNGTNLFSLDHMEGHVDPETLSGYPAMRTFSLGIDVRF